MSPVFSTFLGGIMPFIVVFTELSFIMSSIWLHRVYYVFGFLAVVLLILMITCAEMFIVLVYFQLTLEDYRWWWRSFFCTASSGLYMLLYANAYYITHLRLVKLASVVVYF